jgi:hypothetical protein
MKLSIAEILLGKVFITLNKSTYQITTHFYAIKGILTLAFSISAFSM